MQGGPEPNTEPADSGSLLRLHHDFNKERPLRALAGCAPAAQAQGSPPARSRRQRVSQPCPAARQCPLALQHGDRSRGTGLGAVSQQGFMLVYTLARRHFLFQRRKKASAGL